MILASPLDLSPLLSTPGTITSRDVREFRREIFRDGLVSKYEADAMFMIDHGTDDQCLEWHEFFVEAISDFVVGKLEPRGSVSVENSEWLTRQISRNGVINGAIEMKLLEKILEKSSQCPQALEAFVLQQQSRFENSGDEISLEVTH